MRVAAKSPCVNPECDKLLWLTQGEDKPSDMMTYQLRHGVPDGEVFNVSALDVELHTRDGEVEEFNLPKQAWAWLEKLHLTI